MAVLSLLVGFQSSNVDNFAHIGGFLAGAVLMAVLIREWQGSGKGENDRKGASFPGNGKKRKSCRRVRLQFPCRWQVQVRFRFSYV